MLVAYLTIAAHLDGCVDTPRPISAGILQSTNRLADAGWLQQK